MNNNLNKQTKNLIAESMGDLIKVVENCDKKTRYVAIACIINSVVIILEIIARWI